MSFHVKDANSWREGVEGFVKVDGVWRPIEQGFEKDDGLWREIYTRDNIQPMGPSLYIDNVNNKYLTIQVSFSPSLADINTIRRVRVFVKPSNVTPTNPEDLTTANGYWSKPHASGSPEGFSEFWFNGHGGFNDGRDGTWSMKRWTRTMPWREGRTLANNQRYVAAAFAQGTNGLWSYPSAAAVITPRTPPKGNTPSHRDLYFRPLAVGTVNPNTGVFTEGMARVDDDAFACFYYGPHVRDYTMDTYYTVHANILLQRDNTLGQDNSNMWAGWANASWDELQNGSTKFQYGNLRNVTKLSMRARRNALTKATLPNTNAGWTSGFQTQLTCIVIPLRLGNETATRMQLVSQRDFHSQGDLRVRQSY